MAKITKKVISKKVAAEEVVEKKVKATKTKTATKKATPEKKAPAKKAKVAKTDLPNITTVEDFYGMIAAKLNETEEKTVTKAEVARMWTAFSESFAEFAIKSDAEKATCLLPNIGKLTVFVAKAHKSINPRTMEEVDVPDKKRVSLKVFPRFAAAINEK